MDKGLATINRPHTRLRPTTAFGYLNAKLCLVCTAELTGSSSCHTTSPMLDQAFSKPNLGAVLSLACAMHVNPHGSNARSIADRYKLRFYLPLRPSCPVQENSTFLLGAPLL